MPKPTNWGEGGVLHSDVDGGCSLLFCSLLYECMQLHNGEGRHLGNIFGQKRVRGGLFYLLLLHVHRSKSNQSSTSKPLTKWGCGIYPFGE